MTAEGQRRTAGIRDVAALAGVSVATVSNVFNRPEIVAAATRRKVEQAVAHLDYVRNESARQLRIGQSRTIGLIVPDITNPFFTDVARGVEDVTSAAGALVIVCNSDENLDKERRYLQLLAEQQVQGALVVPVLRSHAGVSQLRDRGIPVVVLDAPDTSGTMCSVSVNDVAGGRLAMEHLLENGHRRVGFIGSDYEAHQVVDRAAGARAALADAGYPPDALVTVQAHPLNVDGGTMAAQQLAAMPVRRRPTAVLCANDLLALGMLYELLRCGIRVPEDVAIVGYDDITFAGAAAVPLTSVRQPRQQLGQRAAELLLEESSSEEHVHSSLIFEPELVIRNSSGGRRRSRTGSSRTGGAG